MDRRKFVACSAASAGLNLLSPFAFGQGARATQGSVEDYFRHDRYAGLKLSPNGRFLAALAPLEGRRNIAIIDLGERKAAVITSLRERDVLSVNWVNDERLVFDLIDLQSGLGEQRPAGLFAINRDGSGPRELAPASVHTPTTLNFVLRFTLLLGRVPKSSDVLVLSNTRSLETLDVYRLNTVTGERALLTFDLPGHAVGWLLDDRQVPRVAISRIDRSTRQFVSYREDEKSPWRTLAEFDALENEGFEPLALGPDGRLYVASRAGSDHAAIHAYDLAAGKLGERLVADRQYDFAYGNRAFTDALEFLTVRNANLIFDPRKKALVGIRQIAEREEFHWIDADWSQLHATVNAALPGRVNRLSAAENLEQILIYSYSDREPGRWYLLDRQKNAMQEVAARRPWLDAPRQSERRVLRYTARDGVEIPAYLTLPQGREPKALPLVLVVHGGPYVRGTFWQWDAEAQFFASRGYAVLQPDFRGSLGYGRRHYELGRRQWGEAMQNDLNDGVAHLVAQGTVDAARVAIFGHSYGGYAAAMGLARDPELFRCGVCSAGVTDLELMGTATWSDMAVERAEFQRWFAVHVGNLDTERERLKAVSPLHLAERIKRPLLIAHGANDVRVPLEHATRLRAALDRTRTPYEWLVFHDEAHGYLREANRVEFYRRTEAFLARHMA